LLLLLLLHSECYVMLSISKAFASVSKVFSSFFLSQDSDIAMVRS
jgi:hypothetical protein